MNLFVTSGSHSLVEEPENCTCRSTIDNEGLYPASLVGASLLSTIHLLLVLNPNRFLLNLVEFNVFANITHVLDVHLNPIDYLCIEYAT
jgi:hypothetical protein